MAFSLKLDLYFESCGLDEYIFIYLLFLLEYS